MKNSTRRILSYASFVLFVAVFAVAEHNWKKEVNNFLACGGAYTLGWFVSDLLDKIFKVER